MQYRLQFLEASLQRRFAHKRQINPMIHCPQETRPTRTKRGTNILSQIVALIVLGPILILCACEQRLTTHGFMPRDELIKQLSPGEQTKDMVSKLMGTPSSIGTFDDRVWYYITQRTKNQAFFKPVLTGQQILALEFDEQEVLQSIKQYGIEEARLIEPLADKTPTVGRKLTLMQQLFGNLGRFRAGDEETGTRGP